MNCDEIRDLLEAYTLGALDETERAELEPHLATCPDCQALVSEYAEIVSLLPQGVATASSLKLPAHLKQNLLKSIEQPTSDQAYSRTKDAFPRRSWLAWFRPHLIVSGSALILLIVFLIWNIRLNITLAQERALRAEFADLVDQQEIVLEIVDSAQTTKRLMRAVEPGSDAPPYGKVYTREEFPQVVAMIARLPTPPPGQAYHLWLTKAGQTNLAGTLMVNDDGFGLLVFDAEENNPTYERAQLTLQPEGSTSPTNPPLILWQEAQ